MAQAVGDTYKGFATGVGNVIRGGGALYGLATGDMDNAATRTGDSIREYWQAGQSDVLKADKAARSAEIDQADGIIGKAGAAITGTIARPRLLVDSVAENVAMFIPAAGAARVGNVAAKAAGATAATATKVGTGAAIATGAAQQGADVSQGAYEAALAKDETVWRASPEFIKRVAAGESPAAVKHEMALQAARMTFPAAAGVSAATQFIPGAAMAERFAAGAAAKAATVGGKQVAGLAGRGINAAKGFAGEGVQEALEEGGGQYVANLANRGIDPNQNLGEGVGEAGGLGFIAGGGLGGVIGAIQRPGAPIVQPPINGTDSGAIDVSGMQPPVQDSVQPVAAGTEQDTAGSAVVAPQTVTSPDPLDGSVINADLDARDAQAPIARPPVKATPSEQTAANMRVQAQVMDATAKTVIKRAGAMALNMQADAVAQEAPLDRLARIAAANGLDPAEVLKANEPYDAQGETFADLNDEVLSAYAKTLLEDARGPAQANAGPAPQGPGLDVVGSTGDDPLLASDRPAEAGNSASQAVGVPAEVGGRPEASADDAAGAQAEGVTPVQAAASEAATSPTNETPIPTEAQKEAGNFKVGRMKVNGLDISVEYPPGVKRKESHTQPLAQAYGYVRRTEGADGEKFDVFLGDRADDTSLPVFVVDQKKADGSFDEHKAMLGYADEASARAAYLSNYPAGWEQSGLGGIKQMSQDEFKAFVRDTKATKAPVATAAQAPQGSASPVSAEGQSAAASGPATPAAADAPAPTPTSPAFPAESAQTQAVSSPSPDSAPVAAVGQDDIEARIAAAEASGVVLSATDKRAIREKDAAFREASRKANRLSIGSSDPMNKGSAFPMGVGFTKMTKRKAQAIDSSVTKAGLAVKESAKADAAGKGVESMLAGRGTEADRVAKAEKQAASREATMRGLLSGELKTLMGFTVQKITKDKDGYPAGLIFSGEGIIKGVNDRIDLSREVFGSKDTIRAIVDKIKAEEPKPAAPAPQTQAPAKPRSQMTAKELREAETAKRMKAIADAAPPPQTDADRSALETRAAELTPKVNALTDAQARAALKAIGEDKASTRPDPKDSLKKQHPDDIEAALKAVQPAPSQQQADQKSDPKPAAQAASEPAVAAKIDDFGETLHGARKHYAQGYADRMRDAVNLDVATNPLSKTWPEPDYEKLLEGGADPFIVAWVHAARDEIPLKPVKSWKQAGWVESVKLLREMSARLLDGRTTKAMLEELLAGDGYARVAARVGGRATLYQEAGHGVDLKGVTLEKHTYTLYRGEKNVTKWSVDKPAKATAFSNWPQELGVGDTREEAIAAFKANLEKVTPQAKDKQPLKFVIYSYRGKPGFVIGKKVGKHHIDVQTFDTVKEAREYLSDNQEALETKFKKLTDIPFERRETNEPRVGVDHRNGADVAPEQFSETFGFRGVQFGNYVEGKRRQQDLNNAYDALLDMAGVLGIPPRALSLNGTLGLAFGARGKGGKRPAAAHYEPDTVVINLTKANGAGSLAHEWWHGLDNYFAMKRDASGKRSRADQYLTESATTRNVNNEGVRPEMVQAFAAIARMVETTGIKERSKRLDTKRTKAYWGTGREMTARSFESYIIARLADQNAANDYLANIVSEEAFGVENGYPYPTVGELAQVRAAYDAFFDTIEARQDGDNVVLESVEDTGYGSPEWDEAVEEALTEAGEPVTSANAAMKLWTDGRYRIFAMHENSGEAIEVTSVDMLRSYTPDQLLALPNAVAAEYGVAERPVLEDVQELSDADLTPAERAAFERQAIDRKGLREKLSAEQGDRDADANGLRAAVTRALGSSGNKVVYLRNKDGLPENVRGPQEKAAAQRGANMRTAGLFHPATGTVYLFTDVVKTPQMAAFTASHEIAGHQGLRALLGDRLNKVLDLAEQNPTVKAVAASMTKQRNLRPDQRYLAIEEALADLAAAVRTKNFQRITDKHGVEVPKAMQSRLRAMIDNLVQRIKDLFRRKDVKFSDAQVLNLLENAWQAAQSDAATVGDTALESVSDATRDAYNARIDALFAGDKAKRPGVRVLDRGDLLGLLGLGDRPVVLAESKVNAEKHGMTAADWKKVPEWLDNPAAVFDSSQPGRLVFIAPEMVNGATVRLIVEPGEGGQLNLLINAFDAHGHQPYMDWTRDKRLRYLHESEGPGQMGRSRLQLPGLPTSTEAVVQPLGDSRSGRQLPGSVRQLRGYTRKVLTQADLVKYRAEQEPMASMESTEGGSLDGVIPKIVYRGAKKNDRMARGGFFAYDRSLAEDYASDTGGEVRAYSLNIQNPLVLDTPGKVAAAWRDAGATDGQFNGGADSRQAKLRKWAEAQGYDSIVVPESAFDGEDGYREAGGTFGEPQIITFRADQARIAESTEDQTQSESDNLADMTQSAAFRKWFGKSVVTNADGSPLVVYHGSEVARTEFRKGFGDPRGENLFPEAFFFSPDIDMARTYGDAIASVYLRLENPFIARTRADYTRLEDMDPLDAEAAVRKLGHDGAILYDGNDPPEYVVFDPAQIKATANAGTFDPTSDSILESVEGFTLSDNPTLDEVRIPGEVRLDPIYKAGFKGVLQRLGQKFADVKPHLLATVPLNHLVDFAPKGVPAIGQYVDIQYQMQAFRNALYTKYDKVAQDLLKFSAEGKGVRGWFGMTVSQQGRDLFSLMHDSTIAGVDPTKDGYPDEKVTQFEALKARYEALPEEGQRLYRETRDAYKAQSDLLDETISNNFRRAMEITQTRAERAYKAKLQEINESGKSDDEKIKLRGQAANAYDDQVTALEKNTTSRLMALREMLESQRVQEPYFPLKRYGKHWVTVLDKDGTMVGFSKFQTTAEQEAFSKEMQAKGYTTRLKFEDGDSQVREMIDPEFAARVEEILQGSAVPDNVKDEVWQAYLERMPDMSMRKSFIHRMNVPGYHFDALKAFGSSQFHGSYQIARLKYGMELQETIELAKEQTKPLRQTKPKDAIDADKLIGEIEKRHAFVMNPKGGAIAQFATTAAFMYSLGANPAHLFLNATQTVMMGVPVLGSRYGFKRTAAALGRAVADFARGKGNLDKANLSADDRKAFQSFMDSGLIDKTQAHDLAGVGETGVEYSAVRQKVMNKIGWFFHQSERFNREVTAMAAYRLARADGRNHEAAVALAINHTYTIHFDYSAASRARFMQGDTAKALLVFRNYNVNMLYRLFRDINDSLRGESPQVKREARKQLGAMMGMYGLFAGTMGMPFYGLAMALAGLGDDDDDPVTAEQQFVNGTVEFLGPTAASLLLRGLPGTAFDIDLSERIGMPNLWFRSPQQEMEGRDSYYYWMEQLLGAGVGPVKGAIDGFNLIMEGQIQRGLERAMPAALRNPMQAIRQAQEGGVTSLDGDLIKETTGGDYIAKAMGFQPLSVSEQYDKNSNLKNADRRLSNRREKLLNQYFLAIQMGDDTAEVMADVQAFNVKNPDYAITRDTFRRSARLRNRNKLMSENGIVMTRRMRRLQERMNSGEDSADE